MNSIVVLKIEDEDDEEEGGFKENEEGKESIIKILSINVFLER